LGRETLLSETLTAERLTAAAHDLVGGVILRKDSGDVERCVRALKILEALEAEEAELVEDLDAGRRCMVKAVEKNQLLVAEMHAASIKMTRKRRRVIKLILAAGDDE
jgi:hypothetical protein